MRKKGGEKEQKSEIEELLEETITTLNRLSVQVSKYDPAGEKEYYKLLGELPKQLKKIVQVPKKDYDMNVSMDILKCVDDGFSPNVWLNQKSETLETRLDETKGKVEGFKVLEKNVLQHLKKWEDEKEE